MLPPPAAELPERRLRRAEDRVAGVLALYDFEHPAEGAAALGPVHGPLQHRGEAPELVVPPLADLPLLAFRPVLRGERRDGVVERGAVGPIAHAATGLGAGALPFGKARIFQEDGNGGSAFVGEDWARFTPRDDELALYLGVARDIVVKRTIERSDRERISGELYRYDLVVKYEIENFKETPVTLDLVEHLRALRAEIGRGNERDPDWTLGAETTLPGPPDPERSDADRLVFHLDLPPRSADGKAEKRVERLHLILNNEW